MYQNWGFGLKKTIWQPCSAQMMLHSHNSYSKHDFAEWSLGTQCDKTCTEKGQQILRNIDQNKRPT
jgi:hypothetical protein